MTLSVTVKCSDRHEVTLLTVDCTFLFLCLLFGFCISCSVVDLHISFSLVCMCVYVGRQRVQTSCSTSCAKRRQPNSSTRLRKSTSPSCRLSPRSVCSLSAHQSYSRVNLDLSIKSFFSVIIPIVACVLQCVHRTICTVIYTACSVLSTLCSPYYLYCHFH